MFDRILAFIFPTRSDEAVVQSLDGDTFLSRIDPTLVTKTNPPTTALLPYADSRVRSVLHEAKYHGNEKSFALLSAALVDYLFDLDTLQKTSLAIIPVPLGRKRFRERGFNQAEEVARRVGKELKMPIDTTLLVRKRETPSQVSLPRFERAENMRDAFGVAHAPDPVLTYILLDDVLTTGATLQSAITTLAKAGAQNILPIALAH